MSPKHVLIVGGTRFVGYLLTWRLLAAGHTVTLFNRGTLPDPFGERVERLHGDRTTPDWERLLSGREFDAVVDFAAYQGEDTRRAVEVLQGNIGQYVLLSTGQVYLVRDGCTFPAREEDYEGTVIPEPEDPGLREGWRYGVGKRAAEDVLIRAWNETRFPATRLRIPIVNGERDYFRRIEGYLWRLLDGGPLVLPGGGSPRCRHVYGAEVARAIVSLLGRDETLGQAYNLCQDEQPSLAELLTYLAELLGAPARLVPVDREVLAPAGLNQFEVSPFNGRWMSRLDPARIRTELGFRHEPLESYLGKIVACFLAHMPETPPPGYELRAVELALARAAES